MYLYSSLPLCGVERGLHGELGNWGNSYGSAAYSIAGVVEADEYKDGPISPARRNPLEKKDHYNTTKLHP